MEMHGEKLSYILQFCFDEGEIVTQAAKIMNGDYGPNTVMASYAQFWFRQFRIGIFDVKSSHRLKKIKENFNLLLTISIKSWMRSK